MKWRLGSSPGGRRRVVNKSCIRNQTEQKMALQPGHRDGIKGCCCSGTAESAAAPAVCLTDAKARAMWLRAEHHPEGRAWPDFRDTWEGSHPILATDRLPALQTVTLRVH